VEIVALRLVATISGTTPVLRPPGRNLDVHASRRMAFFAGRWRTVDVLPRAALGVGDSVEGPAVVEFDEATCVLSPGWKATADDVGTMILERL
jgi:N-methylhydantoinase A